MARQQRLGGEEEAAHNAALIEEIERIARETNYRHRNARGKLVANRSALAEACGLTRGGFDAIYGGGLGRPPTLMALAGFAHDHGVSGYEGNHPYRRLYRIVGWEIPNGEDGPEEPDGDPRTRQFLSLWMDEPDPDVREIMLRVTAAAREAARGE